MCAGLDHQVDGVDGPDAAEALGELAALQAQAPVVALLGRHQRRGRP